MKALRPEESKLVELALGRIFRLASRPEQSGDANDYEACRASILDALEPGTDPLPTDYTTNYARDRFKGAKGDA